MLHQSQNVCSILPGKADTGYAGCIDTDDESNSIQLLKLRGKDQPFLLKWLERKKDS